MLEASFDFCEVVCCVHIFGVFSFAQPNGVCDVSVCANAKKKILHLNMQKVLK